MVPPPLPISSLSAEHAHASHTATSTSPIQSGQAATRQSLINKSTFSRAYKHVYASAEWQRRDGGKVEADMVVAKEEGEQPRGSSDGRHKRAMSASVVAAAATQHSRRRRPGTSTGSRPGSSQVNNTSENHRQEEKQQQQKQQQHQERKSSKRDSHSVKAPDHCGTQHSHKRDAAHDKTKSGDTEKDATLCHENSALTSKGAEEHSRLGVPPWLSHLPHHKRHNTRAAAARGDQFFPTLPSITSLSSFTSVASNSTLQSLGADLQKFPAPPTRSSSHTIDSCATPSLVGPDSVDSSSQGHGSVFTISSKATSIEAHGSKAGSQTGSLAKIKTAHGNTSGLSKLGRAREALRRPTTTGGTSSSPLVPKSVALHGNSSATSLPSHKSPVTPQASPIITKKGSDTPSIQSILLIDPFAAPPITHSISSPSTPTRTTKHKHSRAQSAVEPPHEAQRERQTSCVKRGRSTSHGHDSSHTASVVTATHDTTHEGQKSTDSRASRCPPPSAAPALDLIFSKSARQSVVSHYSRDSHDSGQQTKETLRSGESTDSPILASPLLHSNSDHSCASQFFSLKEPELCKEPSAKSSVTSIASVDLLDPRKANRASNRTATRDTPLSETDVYLASVMSFLYGNEQGGPFRAGQQTRSTERFVSAAMGEPPLQDQGDAMEHISAAAMEEALQAHNQQHTRLYHQQQSFTRLHEQHQQQTQAHRPHQQHSRSGIDTSADSKHTYEQHMTNVAVPSASAGEGTTTSSRLRQIVVGPLAIPPDYQEGKAAQPPTKRLPTSSCDSIDGSYMYSTTTKDLVSASGGGDTERSTLRGIYEERVLPSSPQTTRIADAPMAPSLAPTQPTLPSHARERSHGAKEAKLSSGVGVPGWTAINAAIAGKPFADIEFYIEASDSSAFASRAILLHTCPLLVQKITDDNTLVLEAGDEDRRGIRKSSAPTPRQRNTPEDVRFEFAPTPAARGSEIAGRPAAAGQQAPLTSWRKITRQLTRDTRREYGMPEGGKEAGPSEMFVLPIKLTSPIRRPPSVDNTTCQRVTVQGCSVESLRALLFYLYTAQYRFVDLQLLKTRRAAHRSSLTEDAKKQEAESEDQRDERSRLQALLSSSPEKSTSTATLRQQAKHRSNVPATSSTDNVKRPGTAPTTSRNVPSAVFTELIEGDEDPQTSQDVPESPVGGAEIPPLFNVHAAYSLAHILQLPELQRAAYMYILGHLQPQTALAQYLSPLTMRHHDSLREGILDFIAKHWSAVRAQPETRDVLARLARGDYPGGHVPLLQLLSRLEMRAASRRHSMVAREPSLSNRAQGSRHEKLGQQEPRRRRG